MRWIHPVFAACVVTLAISASTIPTLASERRKVIDFDDELVEGMNKRPLDSVSQLGDASRKKNKPHLYRKRMSFKNDVNETLKTAGLARKK